MKETVVREVMILNKLGLHARAASHLVRLAERFRAEITMEKDGVRVNAKSIMGILMLAAARGTILRLRAQGHDAPEAIAALVKLIEEDRFHEE